MTFPANQESTVLYNPVQVQNRDLSILIISLYAERRAARRAVKRKRKEFHQKKLSREEMEAQLKEYESSLEASDLLKAQQKASAKSDGTTPVLEEGLTILEVLVASGLRSV